MTARRVRLCDECQTPILELRDEGLLIKSRHLGTTHVSIVTWAEVGRYLAEHERETLPSVTSDVRSRPQA